MMATAIGTGESSAVTDPELWREQQRFYNFLQRYDLHKYHQRFQRMGVRRLTHFKDVTDADLDAVGLTPPEKARLRKKWEENFSTRGRIVKAIMGKGRVFEDPSLDKSLPLDPAPQEATLIAKEDIKMTKKLGEGAYGTVFEGTWSNKHGSVVVAVKTLYGTDEVHSTFIKEAQSMRALYNEHIIHLYGIVLSSPLMLIQELAPLGDLHTFLQKNGATKNLSLFHTYAAQIADAMKYLEEKKIVHRDLATRNILLAAEDYVKLSDFGMARILDEQTGIYNLSNLQSRIPIAWTALEALTHAKFSSASDVWSYAVTLWEIYSLGDIPWKGLNPIEIRNCLVRGERLGCPERCPSEIYHVMTSSWEARPQDRPTFASIHERLVQRCQPTQVRAIEDHTVAADEDNNCLSFNKGDLIYVINKPKQGWLYGMVTDGKIGYFLEDHVTTILDPIGGKIQVGKAKVAQLPISHDGHWGKNGEKLGKTEEELMSNQPQRSKSPLQSPPYRVVTSPDHSSPSSSKHGARDNADLPRYATTRSPGLSSSGRASDSLTQGNRQDSLGFDMAGNDQYVTMRRGATMTAEVPEQEDYIDMQPSARYRRADVAGSMYENVGASGLDIGDDEFYTVPRPHTIPPSESSSSDGDSRPGSANRNRNRRSLPPREERFNPALRSVTLPSFSNKLPSQYSEAGTVSSSKGSQEFLADTPTGAISPTMVKYLPTTLPSGATSPSVGDYKSSSLEDMRRTREEQDGGGMGGERGGVAGPNRSPVKPLPKPRARISPEKRSASIDPPNIASSAMRKSSLPDARILGTDLHQLNEILCSEPLLKCNHVAQNTTEVGEALIPIEAPPLPDRTYMTPDSPEHHHQETPHTQATLNNNSTHPKPKPMSAGVDHPLAHEFPDVPPRVFRIVARYKDMNRAREEIQVQILMGMNIPHTKAEDCRRVLKHCQGKIDRAASWLVEKNLNLAERSA